METENTITLITAVQGYQMTEEQLADVIHEYASSNHSDHKGYQHVKQWIKEQLNEDTAQ